MPPNSADEADEQPFNPNGLVDARETIFRGIKVRRGQKSFRDKLFTAYENSCAITACKVADVLEAAHIAPYLGEQTNKVTNGLLLRADLHTLFDCGLLHIEPQSRTIFLASKLRESPDYGRLHGRALRLPKKLSLAPSAEALEEHARLFRRLQ